VPGYYDSDAKTDIAVYRPSNGTWYVLRSTDGGLTSAIFGISTDIPVQGDYDGDGIYDFAVFRSGTWYLLRSSAGFTTQPFGVGSDAPVQADYDGDGKTDVAVFRSGTWYILGSLTGFSAVTFGQAGDRASPADYDGDGKADVTVFRPTGGFWYTLKSSNGAFLGQQFGASGDQSVPGRYVP
jgi:FG-GAP-like repeat